MKAETEVIKKPRVARKKRYSNDVPVYLFHQGNNFKAYEFFGAHIGANGNPDSVTFRVWAKNASAVSVVGDFNDWDVTLNPMSKVSEGGVWEVTVDGLKVYDNYKYAIKPKNSAEYILKADPFAFHAETPEKNASKVYDLSGYVWTATEFEKQRRERNVYDSPMNVYEVNLASWKRNKDGSYYTYNQLATELVPYVKEMGYTHVEFMPVTEYPFDGSWGYQVTGYFAITSRFGTPHDFMGLIDAFHQAGISVILDWVPAHFPKDSFALAEFDGSYAYEDKNPKRREHKGWGTLVFDFGKPEVQSFLISSAFFLFDTYHIDGLRVDAVASMLYLDYDRKDGEWEKNSLGTNINLEAVAFLQKLNSAVLSEYPYGLMIAEESTAFPMVTMPPSVGGLGFNFKWNMGWMNDVLSYVKVDPVYRAGEHNKLTFSMMYAFSENFILPISHDEVVHGKCSLINKMPGEYDMKFAGVRTFMGYMMAHPGKKLNFMGSEYAQFKEWDYREGLEFFLTDYPKHAFIKLFTANLNRFYREHDAFWSIEKSWDGFNWIIADDSANNTVCFERTGKSGEKIIAIINFSGVAHKDYNVGVDGGKYELGFSSDERMYGGKGTFKRKNFVAKNVPSNGKKRSISVDIAPMSFMYLIKTK